MPISTAPVVVFAGGGTGGHLFPALAVADALRKQCPNVRVVFFGTHRDIDAQIVGPTGWELVRQELVPLSRMPWRWPGVMLSLRRACRLSRARLAVDRPAVVVGSGGLGSFPPMREARRAGISTALLNPDAVLGRANRRLAPHADVIFAQWDVTKRHKTGQAEVLVSGCPIRSGFLTADVSRAHEMFALDPALKTLLITGASQGARTINHAVVENLDWLQQQKGWQVLHLTGERDHRSVEEAYDTHDIPAVVIPFTQDMPLALTVADLVVSRAGASTLAELTAVGRAAILMPYPFHKDKHQWANAKVLEQADAARLVLDRVDVAANAPALREVLAVLMADDSLRERLASNARGLGRPEAADAVAERLLRFAKR